MRSFISEMSATSTSGVSWWLRRLVSGKPHQIIGPSVSPYMKRWYLIPHTRWVNLYLHKFERSDEDRALHDHPWNFWSFVVKGSYWEITEWERTLRKRWSLAYRNAEHPHRVQLLWRGSHLPTVKTPDGGEKATCHCDDEVADPRCTHPVWTIVLTGPKIREWGFHCDKAWVPWRYFDAHGGCGEYW